MAIFAYIEGFYNPLRLHSGLDYMSPVEYKRRYHGQAEERKPGTVH